MEVVFLSFTLLMTVIMLHYKYYERNACDLQRHWLKLSDPVAAVLYRAESPQDLQLVCKVSSWYSFSGHGRHWLVAIFL